MKVHRIGFEGLIALKANRLTTENNIPDIVALQALSPMAISITANYGAPIGNYLISASASIGNITITLPSAVSGLDRTYVITKVDSTSNIVTISSVSGLVAGEANQKLLLEQESLSFFSDGTNWQVR